jgi:hypothetical protein
MLDWTERVREGIKLNPTRSFIAPSPQILIFKHSTRFFTKNNYFMSKS